MIARWSTHTHTHFYLITAIVYIEHLTFKFVQNVTNMITFHNTHTKHTSSSIAKVGWLLYQNKIQTSTHQPLCHHWNTTELT